MYALRYFREDRDLQNPQLPPGYRGYYALTLLQPTSRNHAAPEFHLRRSLQTGTSASQAATESTSFRPHPRFKGYYGFKFLCFRSQSRLSGRIKTFRAAAPSIVRRLFVHVVQRLWILTRPNNADVATSKRLRRSRQPLRPSIKPLDFCRTT